jgi:hypothetical protein
MVPAAKLTDTFDEMLIGWGSCTTCRRLPPVCVVQIPTLVTVPHGWVDGGKLSCSTEVQVPLTAWPITASNLTLP